MPNKVALLTGATRGIGLALAKKLYEADYSAPLWVWSSWMGRQSRRSYLSP